MFSSESLQIGDLTKKQMSVVAQNILSINVNYSMDMANQLTITIVDPGLEMASNNYFIVGRDIVYETTAIRAVELMTIEPDTYPVFSRIRHVYEISRVSVSQDGAGASPVYSLEAMPKAIQQMKRDKKAGNIGGSGYEFVRRAATKYGLKFVGEKSTRIKAGSKNSGTGQQDSVWDRIKNIAGESEYVVFVVDGTMYFGTQKWFLFKWGTSRDLGTKVLDKKGKPVLNKDGTAKRNPSRHFIPFEYPGTEDSRRRFEILSMPNITKGENDPMESEGSAIVHRDNGVGLRPGMTIRINNIPNVQKYYVITSVSFQEQVTDPVAVEFRTPERLEVNGKPAKIKPLPIGKIVNSEYFSTKSNIMGVSSIGMPNYNDTQPTEIPVGTTPFPIGEQTKARLPNSRRLSSHPISKEEIKLIVPKPLLIFAAVIDKNNFIQAGNIDMWNRPLLPSTYKEQTLTKCRTLSMFVHSTTVIYQDETFDVYVVLERLFCVDGVVVELSEAEAINKYESESIHHGIFYQTAGLNRVNAYMYVLIEAQMLTVLKRFPSNGKDVWSGAAVIPDRNRCFA
jgi:hypothetical protein